MSEILPAAGSWSLSSLSPRLLVHCRSLRNYRHHVPAVAKKKNRAGNRCRFGPEFLEAVRINVWQSATGFDFDWTGNSAGLLQCIGDPLF